MNINGNNKDMDYRYKRPDFEIKVGGGGNGIYTIFNNMELIGRSINHPPIVLFKYIAKVSGSNYIEAKNQLTGAHTKDYLNNILQEYIEHFVMCPKCSIPETIPMCKTLSKKKVELVLNCKACNNESKIISNKKNIEKGIDILIKYLQHNEWKIPKSLLKIPNIEDKNLSTLDDKDPFYIEEEEVNIDDI